MYSRIKNVCVIGLGYVGLTLAVTLAENNFTVLGIEKNKKTLKKLKNGKPHFYERGLAELIIKNQNKNLRFFNKIPADKKIDVFIVAVATPIGSNDKLPKMEYIEGAINEILPHLKEGQLIILRSTVPVGSTRKVVLPKIRKKCQKIFLSFCPERTIEGDALNELKNLPQIVGALDEESMFKSIELFSSITPTIIKVSSLEVAEIIKLIDNSYRDLIFSYANQIAMICKNLNLDADEVIKSCNFGYKRNNIPKFGFVGGTCLEKDPYILISSAGTNCDLIKTARIINEGLPHHVADRIEEYLKKKRKGFAKKPKVFISGFAFKGEPETNDLRGSPAIKLLGLLKKMSIKVDIYGHDFVVSIEELEKLGIEPSSLEEGLVDSDVAIFMNNHRSYLNLNIEKLIKKMKKGSFLFDGWQIFGNRLKKGNHIIYESLGTKK